jgi:hypothetical protein
MNYLGWGSKAEGNLFYLGWLPEPSKPDGEPKFGGGGRPSRQRVLSRQIEAEDEEIMAFVSAFLCVYK